MALLESCSTSHQLADNTKSNNRHFIEGFTLDNGSNSLETNQNKQVYKKNTTIQEDNGSLMEPEGDQNPLELVKNQSLHNFIAQWYGVPYLLGGTSKLGIDCSAFVQQLYGIVYQTDLMRTANQQFSSSLYIPDWDKLNEGDLVFFKIRSSRISHVGVYLGNGKFVHASASKGVMISDLKEKYWTKYYVGGGKIVDADMAHGKF